MARNKHPEETRELIINTAAKLFVEQGYEETSIQDIINHLGGLSKGAIYHHFKSKDEIMTEVAERMYSGTAAEMTKVLDRKDMNALQKIRKIFHMSAFNPAQEHLFTAAPDMMKNPKLLVLYLQGSVQKEAPEMMEKLFLEGIEDGSIVVEYPKQVAETLMLLGNIWLNPMVYHCQKEEMIEKLKFYHHLLKLLGLDVLDDETIEHVGSFASIYEENKR